MKKITIEIDDRYANVLTVTAVGRTWNTLDVTTHAIDLTKYDTLKIDEKGKQWLSKESEVDDEVQK